MCVCVCALKFSALPSRCLASLPALKKRFILSCSIRCDDPSILFDFLRSGISRHILAIHAIVFVVSFIVEDRTYVYTQMLFLLYRA